MLCLSLELPCRDGNGWGEIFSHWVKICCGLFYFTVYTISLHLSSLHQVCLGSKTSLSQHHLRLRGTHLHRHPLCVLLPSPQSHDTLGSPVPLPCSLPSHLLPARCQTPRYPRRHGVPKTATLQMPTGLDPNTHSRWDPLAPLIWMEDHSVVHPGNLGGYITE